MPTGPDWIRDGKTELFSAYVVVVVVVAVVVAVVVVAILKYSERALQRVTISMRLLRFLTFFLLLLLVLLLLFRLCHLQPSSSFNFPPTSLCFLFHKQSNSVSPFFEPDFTEFYRV